MCLTESVMSAKASLCENLFFSYKIMCILQNITFFISKVQHVRILAQDIQK